MNDLHDLELIVKSKIPIITIETNEEQRVRDLCIKLADKMQVSLFEWSITEGLRSFGWGDATRRVMSEVEVVQYIKGLTCEGIFYPFRFSHVFRRTDHKKTH